MTNGLQVSTSGASATSLSYDLNGNLLNDGTNSYAWDAENRMIKITYPGTGNYSTFSYDGLGRNVSIVETVQGVVTSTKQFVWCSSMMREARDATGTLMSQYFLRGEVIGSSKYFYVRDQISSIREVVNNSGISQSEYSYDPYGRITKLSEAVASDFGYAGYYLHSRSSLNCSLTRIYTPNIIVQDSTSACFRHFKVA